jgi:hypothetical protein
VALPLTNVEPKSKLFLTLGLSFLFCTMGVVVRIGVPVIVYLAHIEPSMSITLHCFFPFTVISPVSEVLLLSTVSTVLVNISLKILNGKFQK